MNGLLLVCGAQNPPKNTCDYGSGGVEAPAGPAATRVSPTLYDIYVVKSCSSPRKKYRATREEVAAVAVAA